MHGRVKVRTTEEQKEIARQEKAKKAVAFKEAMTVILDKRSSENYDQDGLNLTGDLLIGNPDIITLWNYRREILMTMKNNDDLEGYQKLLEKDLNLTEHCLRVNPKSYGSWHHRIWILEHMPEPGWSKELMLCTKYLKLDERNFHCWDYRRMVAEKSNVPDESEYEFTLEKIEANFSNYSAWHLRSKLLPKIFPDQENKFPINESKHKDELELVENAAFTDPNDQSAWFYLRWLLGLTEPKPSILYIKFSNELYVVTSKSIKMALNEEVSLGVKIVILLNDKSIEGQWTNISGRPQSCLWIFKPKDLILQTDSLFVILQENGVEYQRIKVESQEFTTVKNPKFLLTFSENLMVTITNQLSSCNQLIELEPNSKWTLLTSIFLMLVIDRIKYKTEIVDTLEKLIKIDPLRKGYYLDLKSKIIIELAIINESSENCFSVTGKNLSCIYHPQYFFPFEKIDFSQNELSSNSLNLFYTLLNCKHLNLSKNKINDLSHLPNMPQLVCLLIDDNFIDDLDVKILEKFPKLKRISLKNNPIAGKIDKIMEMSKIFVNIDFEYSST